MTRKADLLGATSGVAPNAALPPNTIHLFPAESDAATVGAIEDWAVALHPNSPAARLPLLNRLHALDSIKPIEPTKASYVEFEGDAADALSTARTDHAVHEIKNALSDMTIKGRKKLVRALHDPETDTIIANLIKDAPNEELRARMKAAVSDTHSTIERATIIEELREEYLSGYEKLADRHGFAIGLLEDTKAWLATPPTLERPDGSALHKVTEAMTTDGIIGITFVTNNDPTKLWESKRKRAETALKKLKRQQAYYERKAA